jgi:hypothetical protein
MREVLEERGLVRRTPVGNTTLLSIRTRPLVDASLEILREDPRKWCSPEFYDWIIRLEKEKSC